MRENMTEEQKPKRTVFSALEITALTESPQALNALVQYHERMAREATDARMVEPAEYHTRRAFNLRNEVNRLIEADVVLA